ncbi:MAG: arsenic resistance protein [Desulfomonile tiedjei]|uniref:Arsenic resistance protein n=1 Tax=Desulfomonile tiedjei TaxID=2358 RepID=A0A9D6Z6D1_9BACT|nr:arsenic resistance protein [Desulfomonile tiedjei]
MTPLKPHKVLTILISVFGAMTCGLALGRFYRPQYLDVIVFLALFLMLYPTMLEVDFTAVRRVISNPGLVVAALFLNFLVSPVLIFGLLHLFGEISEPDLMVGITLYGSVPGGGMAPAFTGMLGGNVSLSVTIAAIGSVLSLGIVPLWAEFLIGAQMNVPPVLIFKHLCFIIVLPLIIAVLTRKIILKIKDESAFDSVKERLRPLSGVGLSLILFAMSMLYGDRVLNEPFLILRIAAPVSGFLITLFLLSWLVGRVFGSVYEDAIALTISTTAKNNAVSVALVFSTFGADAALINAIAGPLVQLPMLLGFVTLKNIRKK